MRARKVILARGLDRIDHFSSIFFFKRSPIREREKRAETKRANIRFDTKFSTTKQLWLRRKIRMEPTYWSCSFLLWRIVRRNQKGFRVNIRFERWKKFSHTYIHTRIHLIGIDQERESKEEFKKRKKRKKKEVCPSIANSIIYTRTRIRFYLLLCQFIKRKQKTKKIPIFL